MYLHKFYISLDFLPTTLPTIVSIVLTPAGDLINLTIGDTQNPRVGQLKRIVHMSV